MIIILVLVCYGLLSNNNSKSCDASSHFYSHDNNKNNNNNSLFSGKSELDNNNNNNKTITINNNDGHFLTIIVPSKGSHAEMQQNLFCYYENLHLNSQLGENNFEIIFVEQFDDSIPFNRAMLMNIGSIYSNSKADYFVLTDIDLFPFQNTSYRYIDGIMGMHHMLCNYDQFRQCNRPGGVSLGGVAKVSKTSWVNVNGMSNRFWGWGGEDDELNIRVSHAKIPRHRDELSFFWHIDGIKPPGLRSEHLDYGKNVKIIGTSNSDSKYFKTDGLNQTISMLERSDLVVMEKSFSFCRKIILNIKPCVKFENCTMTKNHTEKKKIKK